MGDEKIIKRIRLVTRIIFAICTAYILCYTFFKQALQQGFSMSPYINDRSVVLVNRLYKDILPIKRNDVIVFYTQNGESIKRVYGLPGETVVITNGNMFIDDVVVENEDLKNSLSSNIEQTVKLGNDEYYVLGDNLDSSKDSRFPDIGNVKQADIIGKVWYIIN